MKSIILEIKIRLILLCSTKRLVLRNPSNSSHLLLNYRKMFLVQKCKTILCIFSLVLCLQKTQATQEFDCVYYESIECWNVEIKDHEKCLTCKVVEANLTNRIEKNYFKLKNGTAFDAKVKMVHFEGGLVDYLPIIGIFEAFPQVHTIYLQKTKTAVISQHFFGKSYQLNYLKIMNTIGIKIEANAFKTASNILDIYFFNNDLKIHSDAFLGLQKLTDLSLVNGTIENVDSLWFKDLHNLQILHLDSNMIRKLEKHTFNNLKNLEDLCLDNNRIEVLDYLLFAGNPKLMTLSIRSNKIKEIQQGIFLNLVNLIKINLEENVCIDQIFENATLIEIEMEFVKCH